MKIRIAAVCSADGKLTRGTDPDITKWASREDHAHFVSLIASHEVIIMGRKTYDAARHSFVKNADKHRIVMTRQPEKLRDAAEASSLGHIEFTSEKPGALIQRLNEDGAEEILVVGGGEINAAFLEAGLVDEVYLTIEPLVFGEGTSFAGAKPLDATFELLSSKQLNDRGSLLLHYGVK